MSVECPSRENGRQSQLQSRLSKRRDSSPQLERARVLNPPQTRSVSSLNAVRRCTGLPGQRIVRRETFFYSRRASSLLFIEQKHYRDLKPETNLSFPLTHGKYFYFVFKMMGSWLPGLLFS